MPRAGRAKTEPIFIIAFRAADFHPALSGSERKSGRMPNAAKR